MGNQTPQLGSETSTLNGQSPSKLQIPEAKANQHTDSAPASMSIDSIIPLANANQLLEQLANGIDPTNLNQLIDHTIKSAA